MTDYKEFRISRPLKGLASDPLPEDIPQRDGGGQIFWHQHDQFHVLNERIQKYPGWQKWTPSGEYGGEVIGI